MRPFNASRIVPFSALLILALSLTSGRARAQLRLADLNADGKVNFADLAKLGQYWGRPRAQVDIAPLPAGDGIIDFKDAAYLARHWLEEYEELGHIEWIDHASVKMWQGGNVIYVDPRNLSESPHDATHVLVTHAHGDHYSTSSIANVSGPQTQFVAPPDVVTSYGSGHAILPGQTIEVAGLRISGVAAYNTDKTNHPKENNWVGFVVQLGPSRVYCAGDTSATDEMKALTGIDVAFLPVDGVYTMTAEEAADATAYFNPQLAIPYHVRSSPDAAQRFAEHAACEVKIMTTGETISLEDWIADDSPIAHWKLDEQTEATAYDSIGDCNGTLHGDPNWMPAGGQIAGAIELDGVGDYISTDFVLNPANGPFSVFAWIKGGLANQVVISQTNDAAIGPNWLAADSSGCLMTSVTPPGRLPLPLYSTSVITDGDWHHIALVWNGSHRVLYVDETAVAEDDEPRAGLAGAVGDLYFGAAYDLQPESFFNGLLDDICIYDSAVKP
ncbi:MAG: MBL fold metallo-hydrolase [Planctomycetota bacterium]|jgi:L-ascorbate metabolism protein UlaG (beta-lactamase superfamily)